MTHLLKEREEKEGGERRKPAQKLSMRGGGKGLRGGSMYKKGVGAATLGKI